MFELQNIALILIFYDISEEIMTHEWQEQLVITRDDFYVSCSVKNNPFCNPVLSRVWNEPILAGLSSAGLSV